VTSNTRKNAWSKSEIEIVRTGWLKGEPASAICQRLKGRSRSSVIGFVKRHGITRPVEIAAKVAASKPRNLRQTVPPAPRGARCPPSAKPAAPKVVPAPIKAPVAAPQSDPVTFAELGPQHCRYPVTQALPHKFCGAAKGPAEPYCPFHKARAVSGAQ
jgi:hypothetical protein